MIVEMLVLDVVCVVVIEVLPHQGHIMKPLPSALCDGLCSSDVA